MQPLLPRGEGAARPVRPHANDNNNNNNNNNNDKTEQWCNNNNNHITIIIIIIIIIVIISQPCRDVGEGAASPARPHARMGAAHGCETEKESEKGEVLLRGVGTL